MWRRCRWLAAPLGLFLATRLIVFYAGFAGLILVPLNPSLSLRPFYPRSFLFDPFIQGDALGYLGILQTGYWYDPATGVGSATVPPLFPALIAAFQPVVGDAGYAGLVLANLAFAFALALFYRLAAARVGSSGATRAAVLLCVFPYAFLLAAAYPYALVLLLALLSLGALGSGRLWPAALCGALAALAHPLGLALWPAQLVTRPRTWRGLKPGKRAALTIVGDLLALALTPVALGAFALYLRTTGGFSLHRIVATLTGVSGPLFAPAVPAPDAGLILAFNLALGIGALLTTPRVARVLGLPYTTFQVGVLVLAALADPTSLGAATVLAFPAFIAAVIYLSDHDSVETFVLAFSGLALALVTAAFVNWYPIGGTLTVPPPSGPRATLAMFHARLLHAGVRPSALPRDLLLTFDRSILLLGYDPPKDRYAPGEVVPIPLYLYTLETTQRGYEISTRLHDATGRQVDESDSTLWGSANATLFEPGAPTTLLQGHYFRQNLALRLAPTLPSGRYTLDVQVFTVPSFALLPLETTTNGKVDRAIHLNLTVANPRDIGPAKDFSIQHPLGADLGDAIHLLGYDAAVEGGALDVPLYWQARARPDHDYTVFVQALNGEGKVVAQSDSYPLDGRYPTTAWQPGEVVRDVHRLALPSGLPPGAYRLIAGMYRLETLQRLPVLRPGQPSADHVELGQIKLGGGAAR